MSLNTLISGTSVRRPRSDHTASSGDVPTSVSSETTPNNARFAGPQAPTGLTMPTGSVASSETVSHFIPSPKRSPMRACVLARYLRRPCPHRLTPMFPRCIGIFLYHSASKMKTMYSPVVAVALLSLLAQAAPSPEPQRNRGGNRGGGGTAQDRAAQQPQGITQATDGSTILDMTTDVK